MGLLVVVLGAVLWQVSVAGAQQLTAGEPFVFQFGEDSVGGVGGSALASNGAAWILAGLPGVPCGFDITEVAPDGAAPPWQVYSVGAPAPWPPYIVPCARLPAALAVSGVRATLAWVSGGTDGQPVSRVFVQRCSEQLACLVYPPQLVARWTWASPPEVGRFTPLVPALASAGRYTVLVFYTLSSADPQMEWAQASGDSRVGAVHSFGVSGDSEPVLVSEPDGRVFAAWFEGCGPGAEKSAVTRIAYAQWTAAAGFSAVQTTPAGRGTSCADLSAAATSTGVTLAWLQGERSHGGPLRLAVWTLTLRGGHASKPTVAYAPGASRFSLAGGSDIVALAPWYNGPGNDPALVQMSVAGKPFTKPAVLDPSSGPPAVSVDSNGNVLATWTDEPPDGNTTQDLAIAPRAGAFSTPRALTLPSDEPDSTPTTIHTIGTRTLITVGFNGLFVNS